MLLHRARQGLPCLIRRERAVLIRGTGVDLDEFRVAPEPPGVPVVMLAGRLLWDKGIDETLEAARRLRADGVSFRLVLVGRPDRANPKALDESDLERWHDAGEIECRSSLKTPWSWLVWDTVTSAVEWTGSSPSSSMLTSWKTQVSRPGAVLLEETFSS